MEKNQSLLALLGRIFLCTVLFWAAGFNIAGWHVQMAMLTTLAQSLSAPVLSIMTGIEIVLGIAILIGYLTRYVASLAAVYTITTACVMHSFWNSEAGLQANEAMLFFDSLGVTGGFLLLAAFGPGEYSADAKLKEPAVVPGSQSESKI